MREELPEVVLAGEPVLKEKAQPVTEINMKIVELLDRMTEVMYARGVPGISAPQLGQSLRMLVIDIGDGNRYEMINPVLSNFGTLVRVNEKCLSVPQFGGVVFRAESVTVEFYDRDGRWLRLDAQGLLAIGIQHEYDHLEGMLFTDRAVEIDRI